MKVRAVISFASMVKGEMVPWPVGKVDELPEGVNWLRLGWVVPVEVSNAAAGVPEIEPAIDEEPKPKRRAKKSGDA